MELNKEEYNWTEKAVVGMALLIQGGSVDSFGEQIKSDIFYEVGKHKDNGMVAILPTDRNQKHEFINDIMKRTNKFN
ncbi:MAG: hypothetical protein IPJ01_11155 [Micavibrio sp.]|nr:hypothetical protein [Micavibrio sp.]